MPIDRSDHSDQPGDNPAEADEHSDRRQPPDAPDPAVPEKTEKDWLEDARRVYGPIDENTPTWHGRDAEGRDISGSGRPDLSPEEVDAHHLAEAAREAAQIREGMKWGVPYSKDTLEWVAKVEAEASAQPPEPGADSARQSSNGGEEVATPAEDEPAVTDSTADAGEEAAAAMPVDEDGQPAIRTDEYKAWYQESGDRDVPGPYLYELAEQVPDYTKALGTVGVLVDRDGNEVWDKPQVSGYEGPAKTMNLALHRNGGWLRSHVEVHAVAEMWQRDLSEACLYVNRAPCPLDSPPDSPQRRSLVNCDSQLEQILPPDSTLTVYGPDGWWKVYRGRPAEGEEHG